LYTHQEDTYGSLVRVFNREYQVQPVDLQEVINDSDSFSVFFTLSESLKHDQFRVVGNIELPPDLSKFPLFRTGGVGPTGKVRTWWLWDGEKQWRIGSLTEAQKSLPCRQIWNIGLMLYRLESRWNWDMDPNL